MNTNPLLEELWAIKDRLDAESGGDIRVFCNQLRAWSAEHLPSGIILCDPKDIRAGLSAETSMVREAAPEYGKKIDDERENK